MNSATSFIPVNVMVSGIPNTGKTIVLAQCEKALKEAGFQDVQLASPAEFVGELSQFAKPEFLEKIQNAHTDLLARPIRLFERNVARRSAEPEPMTLEQIKNYLDALPGVLALYWFMENVNDEHPHRTELFFYCRERARRYQNGGYKEEMKFDKAMFERE